MKILLIYEVLVTLAQNLLQNFKFKEQVNYLWKLGNRSWEVTGNEANIN